MGVRDQTRNIETYKVRPTRVSKFEFHKHQEEMAEQFGSKGEPESETPQTKKQRVAQLTKKAHEKVLKRKKRR